jgi:uncharacterized membrane protein
MGREIVAGIYSVILGVAGVMHLAWPELFLRAMPDYVPWHAELVWGTGVLELAGGAGLWIPGMRRYAARALALYFVAITQAHVHVIMNRVSMFGISDPRLLGMRLLLQFPLIYGAWWLGKGERR